MSFDIVDFHPSITEELLRKALNFASRFADISKNDMDTILQARMCMLFRLGKEWVKKGDQLFDVSMGCYDGAEVCELVGAFVLDKLSEKFRKGDIGLYRDDGLGVFRNTSARVADENRKKIVSVFAELGLKITIQVNLKITDFLDVTLNLSTKKYYPYRKPNDRPMYIHKV